MSYSSWNSVLNLKQSQNIWVPRTHCSFTKQSSPWNLLYSDAICAQHKSLELTGLYPTPSVHSISPWNLLYYIWRHLRTAQVPGTYCTLSDAVCAQGKSLEILAIGESLLSNSVCRLNLTLSECWHLKTVLGVQAFHNYDWTRLKVHSYIYTGCFTTLGHNCRRWFPRPLWSKKFI